MPGLGYLLKNFVFERDYFRKSYFRKKRILMLTFTFDFQDCQQFVPLFSETSSAVKNSWLRACCEESKRLTQIKGNSMSICRGQGFISRGNRLQMFFKIGFFKKFAILTRKHLCWNFFLIKI